MAAIFSNQHERDTNRFTEIYKRECGVLSPRAFAHRIWASQGLVEQIGLYKVLNGHNGCVNAVEFNSTGELLISGSDDKQVKFWDWNNGKNKYTYDSGHTDNIFQTKIMPFSDDRKIVTSGADGQVRLGQVLENGDVGTTRIGKHQGPVFKLAVEPGSPYIVYSCGVDGFVQHFDLRACSSSKLFRCSPLPGDQKTRGTIGLNAIVMDPRNPNYFAVGGGDAYARVYDIRKLQASATSQLDIVLTTFCPHHLMKNSDVHITGLAYSSSSELLASYNDELIYLFQKNMGLGPKPMSTPSEDLKNMDSPLVYCGHRNSKTVKGVSFYGPNHEYVMSGSDCGHIFIWKKKGCKLVRAMLGDRNVVNHLESHPHMPFIATCGIEKKVKIWAPDGQITPPLPIDIDKIMESNRRGREEHSRVTLSPEVIMHVLRLQGRQPVAFIERRYQRGDTESDDEDAYFLSNNNDEEDSTENGSQCIIN
uniref:Uncharacterized protein n=1 Tax=Kalanchoe fedtschenkoi TaxID=63787 RepID=A0A7N0V1L9_KALFE